MVVDRGDRRRGVVPRVVLNTIALIRLVMIGLRRSASPGGLTAISNEFEPRPGLPEGEAENRR